MNLMDAVKPVLKPDSGAFLGTDQTTRDCALTIIAQDICASEPGEEDKVTLVTGSDENPLYRPRPIGVYGLLNLPTRCLQPDDAQWVHNALKDSLEYVAGAMFVTAPPPSAITDYAPVWIGHPDVRTVASHGTSWEDFSRALAQGRTLWYQTVAGEKPPKLHLSPSTAPFLGGVLLPDRDGNAKTIWGDEVVFSAGYDRIAHGAFWAGEIAINYTEVKDAIAYRTEVNRTTYESNFAIVIDVPPCTIIRVAMTGTDDQIDLLAGPVLI